MYQEELTKDKSLDFNDMINKSISVLQETKIIKKYKYIIVDEFQCKNLVGNITVNEITKKLNISRSTFYRLLREKNLNLMNLVKKMAK